MVRLTPEIMAGFQPDPRMKFTPDEGLDFYWEKMTSEGFAYAILDSSDRPVGACGFWLYDELNPRKAEMWAVFSADARGVMPGVTRRTLAAMEAAKGKLEHIRAYVEPAFPQAVKWVLLLGFSRTGETIEAPLGVFDVYEWVS